MNTDALDKASDWDSLRRINKEDNVFTWLGPTVLLTIFIGILVIVAGTTGYFLTNTVSKSSTQAVAILNIVMSIVLFLALVAIIRAASNYVVYHKK